MILYHKLDTHWNYAGAYIGAKSLAEELGINMPSLNEISLKSISTSSGDLTKMLNITIKNGDNDYNISDISTLNIINEKEDFDTELIYHTAGADPRKLFVQRDSFSTKLAPSLSTQFEHSMWVHKKYFSQQQLFDYDADIFVLELVERNEKELIKFKISFLTSSVETDKNETKKISITPAINKTDLQYISILKKINGTENMEEVQVLKPFNETTILTAPENESGKIYIKIFSDETGNKILEEALIEY